MATPKRNPTDTTLRNNRKTRRDIARLQVAQKHQIAWARGISAEVTALRRRVAKLEGQQG